MQDRTAGIFVAVLQLPPTLKVGDLVEVQGHSSPADFAPGVAGAKVRVVGRGSLPVPKPVPAGAVSSGLMDSQWAEVSGVVRSGEENGGLLLLNAATLGGPIMLQLREYRPDWKSSLIDAEFRIRGVLATNFNNKRQATGIRMLVPSTAYLIVQRPAPPNPFALPIVTALTSGEFSADSYLARRIHVRGTVTAVDGTKRLYLFDGTSDLVIKGEGCDLLPGNLIDAVGFPGPVNSRPGLADSLCRYLGVGPSISATPLTANQILPPTRVEPSASGLASGRDRDLQLVQIDGTLLESSSQAEGQGFIIKSQGHVFTALLPGGSDRALESGMQLSLSGVCLILYDQYSRAQSFRLLLRNPDDIVVLAHAPWWNPRLALLITGILLSCFVAFLIWVHTLRKQVARHTQELQQKNLALHQMSVMDPLTGAANRRAFDQALFAEISRATRASSPVSLLMVDLDHFKQLNDEYGHQRGDDYLIAVVSTLRRVASRSTDLVARYGGEEFVVVLPDTKLYQALQIAESMRMAVKDLGITASFGVAAFAEGNYGRAIDLIAAADRALYTAKSTGRDRCVCSEDPAPAFQGGLRRIAS